LAWLKNVKNVEDAEVTIECPDFAVFANKDKTQTTKMSWYCGGSSPIGGKFWAAPKPASAPNTNEG
jgi:hypothetical protein